MTDTLPLLAIAGLGAFHGLNPAMGWLFAVALGLHRQNRAVVLVSLVPIAIGHALSIALVAGLLLTTDYFVPHGLVRAGSAILLVGWAAYHWRYGHHHRVRFGMQVGLWGLGLWPFLMATAHGAGLMLWPALMPLCFPSAPGTAAFDGPVAAAFAGVGIHAVTMILTTAVVAVAVYDWLGVGIIRNAWLNLDLVWRFALFATGGLLLVA
jgi:hypothetical protein